MNPNLANMIQKGWPNHQVVCLVTVIIVSLLKVFFDNQFTFISPVEIASVSPLIYPSDSYFVK